LPETETDEKGGGQDGQHDEAPIFSTHSASLGPNKKVEAASRLDRRILSL
jgi:hypothetical protein